MFFVLWLCHDGGYWLKRGRKNKKEVRDKELGCRGFYFCGCRLIFLGAQLWADFGGYGGEESVVGSGSGSGGGGYDCCLLE